MTRGKTFIVSGPSGVGKSTVLKALMEKRKNLYFSISATTREARPGEIDGVHYHFISVDDFRDWISRDEFLEYAEYVGNFYGTSMAVIREKLDQGVDVILEIEIQGAHKVRAQYPDAVLLFVMPPSAKELYNRLTGRATETEEVIRQRMLRAVEESEGIDTYDYIVVNDKLEDCIAQINTIVNAARHTPSQNIEFIGEIRKELKEFLGSR